MEGSRVKGSFLEKFGFRVSENVQKWMPNPFLFAIILTFITLYIEHEKG